MKLKNTLFVLRRWYEKEGIGKVFSGVISIFLRVFNTLFGIVLVSWVVSIAREGGDLAVIFLRIMILIVLYGLTSVLGNYFEVDFTVSLFLYRIIESPNLFLKLLRLPLNQIEGATGKHGFEKAYEAVGTGNDFGVEGLMKNMAKLATYLLTLLGIALISSKLSPWITMVLLLTGYLRVIKDRKNRQWLLDSLDDRKKLYYEREYLKRKCLDTKLGKDVRIYRMEFWFKEKFDQVMHKVVAVRKTRTYNEFMANTIQATSGVVRDMACYGYLVYRTHQGMAISDFILYFNVIASFNIWVKNIFDEYAKYAENVLSVDFYRQYLMQKELGQGTYEAQLEEGQAYTYTLENVSFSYGSHQVIRDLNLTISAGEKLALVGLNGAGKTTLVKLMCGLYKPNKGRILLNGLDIAQVDPKSLLALIGVVFQESKVFSDSIASNVACQLGKNMDMKRVVMSLEQAGLLDEVYQLPDGPMALLTKNLDPAGIELSGGQYQKLMLARAIYKDAPILILDEPTAALDPLAEEAMYKKYNRLTEGKTSIFISHRLSSTQFCDRVVFLEGGSIIQEGTYEALMQVEGPYKNMFDMQAYYYQEEVV